MRELEITIQVAKETGSFLKEHFYQEKVITESTPNDIKLALDVEAQTRIEKSLMESFPAYSILGEEGTLGDQNSECQWIVDPIDGTVNYCHQIPHFCISIALRKEGEIILGVIYDPMVDELWTSIKGGGAYLNGRKISCSDRASYETAMCFVGYSDVSNAESEQVLQQFLETSEKARKMRLTGSTALALAYIASGRYDLYFGSRICIWDIAAGQLLVEEAGGAVNVTQHPIDEDKLRIRATNGKLF